MSLDIFVINVKLKKVKEVKIKKFKNNKKSAYLSTTLSLPYHYWDSLLEANAEDYAARDDAAGKATDPRCAYSSVASLLIHGDEHGHVLAAGPSSFARGASVRECDCH